MIGLGDAMLVGGGICALLALYLAIKNIRRDHPEHVQTLWYIFFLTLCVVFPYYLYYVLSGEFVHDLAGHGAPGVLQEIRKFIFDTLTDPVGDIYFALAVIYVAMVPQILSFIISSAFSCASKPILGLATTKFALLGLIKSFCVLSAILVARMLLQLCVAREFFGENNLYGHSLAPTLFQATIYLVLTFGMMIVYLRLDGLWALVPTAFPWLARVVDKMTLQNRPAQPDSPPHDLERLLRPVIGHLLGDIEVKEVANFILERRLRGRPNAA